MRHVNISQNHMEFAFILKAWNLHTNSKCYYSVNIYNFFLTAADDILHIILIKDIIDLLLLLDITKPARSLRSSQDRLVWSTRRSH